MFKKFLRLAIVAFVLYLIFLAVQYIVVLLGLPSAVAIIVGVILLLIFIERALSAFEIELL